MGHSEKARVDRIACPWLISRFIDRDATFCSCRTPRYAGLRARKATPYDVAGVELGHHGDSLARSIAFLDKYRSRIRRYARSR